MNNSEAEKLANEHWEFLENLLSLTSIKSAEDFKEIQKFLFVKGFIHGYKHALENK